jgi:hypothetical protein
MMGWRFAQAPPQILRRWVRRPPMLLVDDAIDYRGGISQPPHELCNVSLRRDPRENGRQDENRRRERHAQSHDRPSMFKAGQEPEKRIHAAQHGKVTAIEEHDIAGVAVRAIKACRDRQQDDREQEDHIEIHNGTCRTRLVSQPALVRDPKQARHKKADQESQYLRLIGGPDRRPGRLATTDGSLGNFALYRRLGRMQDVEEFEP